MILTLLLTVITTGLLMLVPVEAGASSDASDASAPSSATMDWGDCSPFFTVVQVPPPIFERLQAGCGRLAVPLDYDLPEGPQLELAVMRIPARRPDQRIGTLVVNPGGPGGSGVSSMFDLGGLPPEIHDRFDLVGFDPRGMVRSEPIDCFPPFRAPEAEDDLWSIVHDRVVACASSQGWLLPYLGTNNVARDLEQLRIALGEAQLNYIGFSYGSAIGATYAELYPDRVRSFVLDGAVDTSKPLDELLREQTLFGAEQLFARFAASCDLAGSQCPIAGRAATAWADVLDHARQGTLTVRFPERVPLAPAEMRELPMTADFVRSLLFDLLNQPQRWQSVAGAIAAAAAGDATGFLEQVLGGPSAVLGRDPYLQLEGFVAVTCVDTHDRPSLADVTAARRTLQAQAPTFSDLFLAESALACVFWPASTDPVVVGPAAGSAPILVVGNTGDPNTPYPWAQALHERLAGSALLTWDGVGHTVFATGRSACIDEAVGRYLVDGAVPEPGTVCPGPANPFLR